MKANIFSYILILFMMLMLAKVSTLVGRIQEQTSYSPDNASSSVLIDTAYANSASSSEIIKTGSRAEIPEDASSQNAASSSRKKQELFSNKPMDQVIIQEDNAKNAEQDSNNYSFAAEKIREQGSLSRSEKELLKKLSARRASLEREKKQLGMKEQILHETEAKIDQKVVELKNLQTQVEGLMKQYENKEQGKIMSLVKIYETMKPRDAAKIFNELDMSVLIRVVSNMKEVKLAPILASMDPVKARDLSLELAKQKTL